MNLDELLERVRATLDRLGPRDAWLAIRDGARLVSASRDRAIKLIDVTSGLLVDDLAKPREPLLCIAQHPKEDLVAFGSDAGQVRLHKIAPRGGRLAEGDDKEESSVREFERFPGPVHSLAFSSDGTLLAAAGSTGEARVWKTTDGKRVGQIPNRGTALFSVAFSPDDQQIALAGADGQIVFHDVASGKALKKIVPVPIEVSSR